jgi:hypothetical protein
MKLRNQLTVCIWFTLAACSSTTTTKVPAINSNYAVDAPPPSDEAFKKQPAGTILNFLRWYRANVPQLKKIEIVSKSTHPDSSMYYVVNDAGTEQYLAALQQSGFVTENYLNRWRMYFRKCTDNLQKTPVTEAAMTGLDFDLVMLSKDFDEDLSKIERSTVEFLKVANDEGSITVGLPTVGRLKYWISKQDGKWLIEDIKDMRSALDQAQND